MQRKNDLNTYLSVIGSSFDIGKIINEKQEREEILSYYLVNHFAYLFFHNRKGFMHMGISKGNRYYPEDLLTHLVIIQEYIKSLKANKVLEIGCGNGSNSIYLARNNPSVSFEGIDLSKKPMPQKIRNYSQRFGDYHHLEDYKNDSYDLIFVIEALCHSNRKDIVLKEVRKKLRKGGVFIIFDGYVRKPIDQLSDQETIAKKLTEKTMAVDSFEYIEAFNKTIQESGLKLIKKNDYSQQIMPTLKRFERQALIFFSHKIVTKTIKVFLPSNLVKNSIAGLLMPILIEKGVACYYLHVLQKTK